MKKKRIWFWLILLGLVGVVVVSSIQGAVSLEVTEYHLTSPKLTGEVRLVHLTDLHNREFGDGNHRLLEKVRAQQPDLILLTGDLVIRYEPERQPALDLLGQLAQIAPTYVSLGNHELEHQWRYGVDLVELYTRQGVTVLEGSFVDLQIRGQTLRLGGISGFCHPGEQATASELEFFRAFEDTDHYKLLLCHRPLAWTDEGALDHWDVDGVLAGHVHGGQVQLPLIGGVVDPDRGLFPGRSAGLWFSADGESTLVLSRGLGTSVPVPRVFNRPEVVVLTLGSDGSQ